MSVAVLPMSKGRHRELIPCPLIPIVYQIKNRPELPPLVPVLSATPLLHTVIPGIRIGASHCKWTGGGDVVIVEW